MEPLASQPRRSALSAHIPAFIAILCWATTYPLTRLNLQHFSAVNLAFSRFVIGTAALLALALVKGTRAPKIRDWPWFIAGGVTGYSVYMVLFCKGCETANSATSSVVIALTPVITAFLARVFLKEKLSPIQWGGIGVGFAGIVILTLMNGALSVNVGIAYLTAGAFLLAGYNLVQRKITLAYSALDATLYCMMAGTIMLAIFLPGSIREVAEASGAQLGRLVLIGIVPSAIAYGMWSEALAKAVNTAAVSNYMFVTPFFAAVLGFYIAGEEPDTATIVGGSVIMAGLLLFVVGGRRNGRKSQ